MRSRIIVQPKMEAATDILLYCINRAVAILPRVWKVMLQVINYTKSQLMALNSASIEVVSVVNINVSWLCWCCRVVTVKADCAWEIWPNSLFFWGKASANYSLFINLQSPRCQRRVLSDHRSKTKGCLIYKDERENRLWKSLYQRSRYKNSLGTFLITLKNNWLMDRSSISFFHFLETWTIFSTSISTKPHIELAQWDNHSPYRLIKTVILHSIYVWGFQKCV